MTQPEAGAPSGTPDLSGQSAGAVAEGTQTGTPATPPAAAPSGEPATPNPAETVSKADFERVVNQLRAADQKRTAAEKQLQEIHDKDLPEIERLKRDTAALTETNQRLVGQLKEQAVELAFLRDNKVRWKDSAAALKLLDRSQLQVGDDGTVEGVKLASEKLAKQYPFMVDDAKPEGGTPTPPPAAGTPPMNGSGTPQQPNSAGMVKRLPALASRRRPNQ